MVSCLQCLGCRWWKNWCYVTCDIDVTHVLRLRIVAANLAFLGLRNQLKLVWRRNHYQWRTSEGPNDFTCSRRLEPIDPGRRQVKANASFGVDLPPTKYQVSKLWVKIYPLEKKVPHNPTSWDWARNLRCPRSVYVISTKYNNRSAQCNSNFKNDFYYCYVTHTFTG